MPIYRIPVYFRFTSIAKRPVFIVGGLLPGGMRKLMHVDEVGLFVTFDKGQEEELTPENIRCHLIGRTANSAFVEADNPEKAIQAFFLEYEGTRVGGEHEEAKAIWIDRTKNILELPICPRMQKNSRDDFVCVFEGENIDEAAGCVLSHYDAPDDLECPLNEFYDAVHELEEKGLLPIETIAGYKFVRAENVVALAPAK